MGILGHPWASLPFTILTRPDTLTHHALVAGQLQLCPANPHALLRLRGACMTMTTRCVHQLPTWVFSACANSMQCSVAWLCPFMFQLCVPAQGRYRCQALCLCLCLLSCCFGASQTTANGHWPILIPSITICGAPYVHHMCSSPCSTGLHEPCRLFC